MYIDCKHVAPVVYILSCLCLIIMKKIELLFLFLKALFPLFSQSDTAQLMPVKGKTDVIDYRIGGIFCGVKFSRIGQK